MPDGGRILVSEESADYRPEMEWLAQQVGADIQVETAETATAGDADTYRSLSGLTGRIFPKPKNWRVC